MNGVMPLGHQADQHYVPAPGEDYNGVAATLSNWAEANAAVDGTNQGLSMGPQGTANGGVLDQNTVVDQNSMPAMPEKPKKLVLACHFCRGRKLKCDGGRPTCSHCAKRNLMCSYDDQVRRRGPGKRTKEMRERAAREAEAAGLGLNPESLAHLTDAAGPSMVDVPKKAGRKRKSEAIDDADKKVRLDEEHHLGHEHVPHTLAHGLGDQSLIDPALGGDGAVLDLPPLEEGTLGQVIQQLNGAQQ